MDKRLLDILIGISTLFLLVLLLYILPPAMGTGLGYTVALLIYVAVISGAGWAVIRQTS